eukprot:COSAG01_NODE_272_length_19747_cov_298.524023_7_plen_95_part_00
MTLLISSVTNRPRTLAPGCVHIDMASVLDDLEATIGELDRDTISAHNPLVGVNGDGQRHYGHAAIHTVADDDVTYGAQLASWMANVQARQEAIR